MLDHNQKIVNIKAPPYAQKKNIILYKWPSKNLYEKKSKSTSRDAQAFRSCGRASRRCTRTSSIWQEYKLALYKRLYTNKTFLQAYKSNIHAKREATERLRSAASTVATYNTSFHHQIFTATTAVGYLSTKRQQELQQHSVTLHSLFNLKTKKHRGFDLRHNDSEALASGSYRGGSHLKKMMLTKGHKAANKLAQNQQTPFRALHIWIRYKATVDSISVSIIVSRCWWNHYVAKLHSELGDLICE